MFPFIEKQIRLADPVATTGDRVYVICSQNGLFPTSWQGHVPHEMGGVWDHPIKLLDSFWFALRSKTSGVTNWLSEADVCRVGLGYTEFDYRVDGVRVTRRDVAPDGLEGLIVTLTVQMPEHFTEELEVIVSVRSDLRPAWLGEQAGLHDGPDQAEAAPDRRSVIFHDENNPWFAIVGSDLPATDITVNGDLPTVQLTMGQGASAQLLLPLTDQAPRPATLTLLIAGSSQSAMAAQATFEQLQREHPVLTAAKQASYQQIAQQSELIAPDAMLNEAFQWAKVNCQMLARATPTHGLGAGAGLPTYPWWFGIDTEYAVLPMLQAGLFDLTKATLRLLKQVSETENRAEPGRVIHEMSTTGIVHNPGNLVETPAFTRAVHQTWLWTGDQTFLTEMYPFCKQGVLDYTLGQCDADGDLCPSGRSVIETLEMHAGFECIDLAVYTWEALTRLADMAQAMGDQEIIPELRHKADNLAHCIQEEWWLPTEGLFADVRASTTEVQAVLERLDTLAINHQDNLDLVRQVTQAHHLFDPLLTRYQQNPSDIDLPWLLRHWVVMCPVEVGVATPEQARRTLDRLTSPEFCNEWGMYLNPDRHDVMSINTGLLALAHMRYGWIDQALDLVQRMVKTLLLYMPGAISEALPNQWCFIQLWSALGVISPVVEGVFGIEPRAGERKLRVVPNLPTTWDQVAMRQVHIGEQQFDIQISRDSGQYHLVVTSDAPDYQLTLGVYLPETVQVQTITLNQQPVVWRWETTLAGRCLLCEGLGNADLIVTLS
ncbi:MAG: hypothetical protein NT075_05870 [Chloroflexi bacterium]|nr:hypothetical protein [Chloroflexota bacterium]